MTNEEAEKLLEKTARDLGEFFANVQILVSWPGDTGNTKSLKKGVGDFYARQGLAHEFINEDMAKETAHRIGEELKDPPDNDWKTP